jgi:hypothetical protein
MLGHVERRHPERIRLNLVRLLTPRNDSRRQALEGFYAITPGLMRPVLVRSITQTQSGRPQTLETHPGPSVSTLVEEGQPIAQTRYRGSTQPP